MFRTLCAVSLLWLTVCTTAARADLITNPALPIVERVTVQPIIVSNTDGSNTAKYFGTSSQQDSILGLIDDIWAQAGIDIDFLTPNTWNNTFANIGTPGANDPRPTTDLSTVVFDGDAAGVGNPDPFILDMYFVEISPGFSQLGNNFANGLAFVGGNGITMHVGDNLPGFLSGREVVAKVVAHEIGHNLGLGHISEAENLMQPGGSPNPGERLNTLQVLTALGSDFSRPIAVPEPNGALLAMGWLVLMRRRSRG